MSPPPSDRATQPDPGEPDPDRGAGRWATATSMEATLDLEQIDRDIFRGVNAAGAEVRHTLYGGQVAAQALRAAQPDRRTRPVPALAPRLLPPPRALRPSRRALRRPRPRRAFLLPPRHVTAVQDGEVIFSMLASFHRDEAGGTLDRLPHVSVAPPESRFRSDWAGLLDIAEVTTTDITADRPRHTDRLWVRVAAPLPDDRVLQACALAYVSDLGSGFGQIVDDALPPGGPSIDHALWFHDPIRVDDWVILEMWPDKAGGSRGVYHGTVRDRDGRLGAMLAQEMLLRPPPG